MFPVPKRSHLGMDGIEDGGGVHARSVRDELGASGMDLSELGQVVGLRRGRPWEDYNPRAPLAGLAHLPPTLKSGGNLFTKWGEPPSRYPISLKIV